MGTRTRSSIGAALRRWRADRRGAVALEFPFVFGFLMFILLLPLADVAIAGFQYISAYAALRSFGQYVQYHTPPDVTNSSSWKAALPASVAGYTISNLKLMCNTVECDTTHTLSPKYYTYSTSVTLSPMILKVLCSTTCTSTLNYSEQFQ